MRENLLADRESSVLSAQDIDRAGGFNLPPIAIPGNLPGADVLLASELGKPSRLTHRVVVYSSDEAVPSQRFIAYITVPTKDRKTAVMSERRLGISFAGADDGTARSAAEAYWQGEMDRERAKLEASIKRGEALTASRELRKASVLPVEVQS